MFINIDRVKPKSCQNSVAIRTDTIQCRLVNAFKANVLQQDLGDS